MSDRADQTRATTRLYALVAREARTAVVFRRGPSKQVQMLRWDLVTDVLTPGQWLAGRIYNERCGLSPDGKLLVYFAGKFNTEMATFTAISRPPYFTALALWPDGETWGGGGFFEGNRRVILNYARVIDELHGGRDIPADFEVSCNAEYRARRGQAEAPESGQGWILRTIGVDGEPTATMRVVFAEPWVHEKPHPTRKDLILERRWLGMFEVNGPNSVHDYRLAVRPSPGAPPVIEELGRLDWADWGHDGALLFSEDGCLFRRTLIETRPRKRSTTELIADLRANTFTNVIPPPEARVWP
jgi:hypothetical protein